MKAESSIAGPWTDKEFRLYEKPKMTRQLQEFMQQDIRLYQRWLFRLVSVVNDRKIVLVVDFTGGSGKTITVEWLRYRGLVTVLPPFLDIQDILAR